MINYVNIYIEFKEEVCNNGKKRYKNWRYC